MDVRQGTYSYTLPFNTESYGQDNFLYTFDSSYTYEVVLGFPSQMRRQYISGTWTIPVNINFTHQYYVSDLDGNVTLASSSPFSDSTFRFDLSWDQYLEEGLSLNVIYRESASLSQYSVVCSFSDFYVYEQYITVPVTIHFLGSILNEHNVSRVNLSAYNVGTTFAVDASYTASNIGLTGSTFQNSSLYYSVLNAINASNASGSGASLTVVEDILSLLESWTEDSNGVMVDFPYFSDQVLTYLGSLDSNTDDLESYMSTALGYLITIMDNTDQLETYLSNIYNTLHLNNYSSVNTSITPYKDVVSLLVSLCAGFTGAAATSQSISSIRTTTYNRWVSLITEAVVAGLEQSGQASSADQTQYENDMDTVSSVGSANHAYEVSLWTDVQSRYQNIVGDATPPGKTLDSAVWFTSAVEYVWSHLGIFAFVISVTIVGGYLVIVLGRINQFGRIK